MFLHRLFAQTTSALLLSSVGLAAEKPNILWIVTDDQRADSLACFNQAVDGRPESALGHVSSPALDQLASEGVLFTHAYCNSPACAPSRVSMITGRYPHRNGTYGFRQSHEKADFCRPTFPVLLRDEGYATARFGKSGVYIFDWGPGLTWNKPGHYDVEIDRKNDLERKGLTDFYKTKTWGKGKPAGSVEQWHFPDGTMEEFLVDVPKGEIPDADLAKRKAIDEKHDVLRAYTRANSVIIVGGVSSQPAGKTLDGHIASAAKDYIAKASSDKPLFVNVGFHFPHTPVLPPKKFRDHFAGKTYKIPDFSRDELKSLPRQLVTLHDKMQIDQLNPEEKQQAIRDYYAFCAYGDSLIGETAKAFREKSEAQGREWVIYITCGDHGWHLGEQGYEAKFGPYDKSNRCAVIALSSNKKHFPAGTVCDRFVEFVDFAPSFLAAAGADLSAEKFAHFDGYDLEAISKKSSPQRDYVIGELNHVCGPRAYLRTKDFAFSMRVRPAKGYKLGKDMKWGLTAPRNEVEMSLFDLRSDAGEQCNVANESAYLKLADFLRKKLANIVLGDGRVECDWTQENSFTLSDFAPGAHDGKLNIPSHIISLSHPADDGAARSDGRSASSKQPNVVILFADDISARELPIYGSSVWTDPLRNNTSDPKLRAKTPVLDQLAYEGCWITTAWAATVCSPSRAMMMTGRHAHLHKWWDNKGKGLYQDDKGNLVTWPLYLSSPLHLGHVAQSAGYQTYWAGKTQMAGDLTRFGYHRGCFTPGSLQDKDNPYTDFKHFYKKVDGDRILIDADTGNTLDTYQQHGWYFYPHVRLMNHGGPEEKDNFQWFPNTDQSRKEFGLHSYGPDIELDFIFDHIEEQHAANKPFFVYHCSHLGHDAYDWLHPESPSSWPGTPVIQWDGEKYTRTPPKISGDKGQYETNGTVTEPGMHRHVNYLDYQVWLYQQKFKELGIADNTIFVFCADNGTGGYGKRSSDRQKGTHVPLIIHAPGMTKKGEQDVLVSMADFLPTLAELTGGKLPADYEHNGKSLVPFLFGKENTHRDHLYAYQADHQIIRGNLVLRDGRKKWWDVSKNPADLISFPEITDWSIVSEAHRAERDKLLALLPKFSVENTTQHAPGIDAPTGFGKKKKEAKTSEPKKEAHRKPDFKDTFDSPESLKNYDKIAPTPEAWTVVDEALIGTQIKANHGCVIRKNIDFADLVMEIDVRFNGGSRFNFVFDDSNEKSVWASHICRISLSPKYLNISDDKTGAMNLEIRNRRKAGTLTPEDEKILAASRTGAKVDLKKGEWHKLRVVIKDDIMKAFIDGKLVNKLKSPGIAHPTKTKLGMTVNGSTIEFDNFKVWDSWR